jgi:hypothetical protein
LGVIYDHLDNIYEKNDDIDNKREYIKAKYQNGHTGYNRVKREKDYIEKL